MKVHIVSRDLQSDTVLGRLVRDLVVGTDWSCSPVPDNNVDVNYFFPYLEYGNAQVSTVTAAWFTHYDLGRKGKEAAWDRAAQGVDLRLTSAPMYRDALIRSGHTELVTPPIDLSKFTVCHSARPERIVGVSGFVYPGGRKGEKLVGKLMQHAAALGCKVVGSGKGWPCVVLDYSWENLQDYYHSLSVYLCTAIIEGIPMPPLEAMACGLPVVIPSGVGLLDTLTDLPNVYRYKAGDFDTMLAAVSEALDAQVDTEALRYAVTGYTSAAWACTHLAAMSTLFGSAEPVPDVLPDWKGRAGVYVVAYGDPARQCATRLVKSVHQQMPGLPVAVASDRAIDGADIFISQKDLDIGGRSVKTQIYQLTPPEWDYVLYLDADTEVVADISFLFDLLADGWELVFCTNPPRYSMLDDGKRPDNQEEIALTVEQIGTGSILQLNGGVFAFRRCKATERFCAAWFAEWQRWGARDQAALDRALYANPLRLYVLGCEWNTSTRYFEPSQTAGILHHQMEARRWKGRIKGRLDSGEAWAALHPSDKPREDS